MEAIEKSSKHETKIYRDARDVALPITAPRKKNTILNKGPQA